jgi:hypothetical protein
MGLESYNQAEQIVIEHKPSWLKTGVGVCLNFYLLELSVHRKYRLSVDFVMLPHND